MRNSFPILPSQDTSGKTCPEKTARAAPPGLDASECRESLLYARRARALGERDERQKTGLASREELLGVERPRANDVEAERKDALAEDLDRVFAARLPLPIAWAEHEDERAELGPRLMCERPVTEDARRDVRGPHRLYLDVDPYGLDLAGELDAEELVHATLDRLELRLVGLDRLHLAPLEREPHERPRLFAQEPLCGKVELAHERHPPWARMIARGPLSKTCPDGCPGGRVFPGLYSDETALLKPRRFDKARRDYLSFRQGQTRLPSCTSPAPWFRPAPIPGRRERPHGDTAGSRTTA
jgi:hypothetical protein